MFFSIMKIKKWKGVEIMKINWKPWVRGVLALTLVAQPVLTQAAVIQLPKEVKVNYPKEFKEKIEDIKICLLEAENKIYDSLETSDKEKDLEKSKDSEKPIANNIHCESMIEKYELSDLDNIAPDEFKETNSPYLKETRELRIAMALFLRLNEDMHGEIAEKQTPDDMVDQVLYRIFNLLYELPKVQGHPMIIEFVRDVRDSFLNVIRSEYFKSVVYFFYHQNPDKELTIDLLRFVYHLEQAEESVTEYIPDENMEVHLPSAPVITLPESQLPELTPEEQAKEDLDQAWEQEIEKIEAEEKEEHPPVLIVNEEPRIEQTVYVSYEVKEDKCMKITETYMNNKYQGKKSEVAPSEEAYNCGRLEDIDWDNELENEDVEDTRPMVYYRYGNEEDLLPTDISLSEPLFDYETLVDVLRVIASEQGVGSLGGNERYLFAISGKPVILMNFEETKTLEEVNKWLTSKKVPIQLVIEEPDQNSEDDSQNE